MPTKPRRTINIPKPISGYKLAQIITGESRPLTARIYTTLKSMIKENLIFKTGEGYQSNPEPLVEEIEKDLNAQNISLTENEKFCVLRILQNEFFKEMISIAIEKEYMLRDVDAVREISNILGACSIRHYNALRFFEKLAEELPNDQKLKQGLIRIKNIEVGESTSKDPKEQIFHYLQANLSKKLIKLFPVDFEKFLDMIEDAEKRIGSTET